MNVINKGRINIVSNIYYLSQQQSLIPMETEIKRITHLTALTVVPYTYEMILTMINVIKMSTEMFLQRQ